MLSQSSRDEKVTSFLMDSNRKRKNELWPIIEWENVVQRTAEVWLCIKLGERRCGDQMRLALQA